MTRADVFTKINDQRDFQDAIWSNREQYRRSAAHVLVLQGQMRKLEQEWYDSKRDALQERFVKIAAIAVRALEEIEPNG
ncbi:hypothetical protein LCGC14_2873690 [marine sediment metagenome]|uniref:Uncharacterized protein n=1 Tax=marine sediment metagenome TaxID=412755 RepID=A0A0F8YNZ6_9ZZZZ